MKRKKLRTQKQIEKESLILLVKEEAEKYEGSMNQIAIELSKIFKKSPGTIKNYLLNKI